MFSIPVGVVYRPNEAKVRNLKTKDYLGKARLVAASDRANAFTGFAGSEIKNAGRATEKDDRPTDNISFAATNLVKPGLQSKRQQSEPPASRNAFPPTPPPENDKPASMMTRGASVRNGPKPMPARLNIPETAAKSNRYDKTSSPQSERKGPTRSASEARSPPQRGYSRNGSRAPRRSRQDDDGYPDDVYDMYDEGKSQRGGSRRNQPRYIEEEEEASDYDSFDEGEFEMVSNRRPGTSVTGSSRGGSRRPDIRKVRIKVHSEDVRYVMVSTTVEFPDLVDRIRDKFALRRRFKLKVRDEDAPSSEMITMGDQDDLDMVMMTAKQMARKQKQDIGKMEVSFDSIPILQIELANKNRRYGSRKSRHFSFLRVRQLRLQRYPSIAV